MDSNRFVTIRDLHTTLADLIHAAARKDKEMVRSINDVFESIFLPLLEDPAGRDCLCKYDNCRQSCVAAVLIFPELYDRFMADAYKRFEQLSERQKA